MQVVCAIQEDGASLNHEKIPDTIGLVQKCCCLHRVRGRFRQSTFDRSTVGNQGLVLNLAGEHSDVWPFNDAMVRGSSYRKGIAVEHCWRASSGTRRTISTSLRPNGTTCSSQGQRPWLAWIKKTWQAPPGRAKSAPRWGFDWARDTFPRGSRPWLLQVAALRLLGATAGSPQ